MVPQPVVPAPTTAKASRPRIAAHPIQAMNQAIGQACDPEQQAQGQRCATSAEPQCRELQRLQSQGQQHARGGQIKHHHQGAR